MPELDNQSIILLHGLFEGQRQKTKRKDLRSSAFCLESPKDKFFVLEGRPNLDSAVSNSFLLLKSKIKPTLIADNMAGFLFSKKFVKEVRIAYQDTDSQGAVCDVGAIILGILAHRHKVPVYLYPAKVRTRFLGNSKDLTHFKGKAIAPQGARAYVPLVEWLPNKYITKIY